MPLRSHLQSKQLAGFINDFLTQDDCSTQKVARKQTAKKKKQSLNVTTEKSGTSLFLFKIASAF